MTANAKPKLALIGIGKIAIDQHLPSIAETGLFELAGVVSRRGVAVPVVPTFKTQADLFAAVPDLAAVANCTPPHAGRAPDDDRASDQRVTANSRSSLSIAVRMAISMPIGCTGNACNAARPHSV